MNLRMNFRLAALVLAMGLMGVVIAYITVNSQREASDLQTRLNTLDLESSEISDQFRESFRNLNNMVIGYGIDRDPATWEKTRQASRDLDHWIDAQKFKMQNPAEKDILLKIDQAYNGYEKTINDYHAKIESLRPQQEVLLSDYTPARDQGSKLIDLSHQLAEVHLSTRDELISQVHQTLSRLRLFTLASLVLLFLFALALFLGVYQDLIAPLRVKLVESQAVAERREKLASLGLLAAGVAHEIRTPLTAIKAALYLQKKKLEVGSPEYQNVDVVDNEIRRLERIIKDFIRFARPAEPQTAVLDVDILMLELQRIFTPQLGEANIQLIMEILTPMQIRADSGQIKQVLINLVQNAADSIGRDGKITLRARPDQRRLANNGEVPVVALEVADSGKGIPPEVEKRLFDPFFTTKESGHGLGLSIAAQIVQKHGGELEYQTMINRGTTFGVILPRLTS